MTVRPHNFLIDVVSIRQEEWTLSSCKYSQFCKQSSTGLYLFITGINTDTRAPPAAYGIDDEIFLEKHLRLEWNLL
jgi:hypothetical protein